MLAASWKSLLSSKNANLAPLVTAGQEIQHVFQCSAAVTAARSSCVLILRCSLQFPTQQAVTSNLWVSLETHKVMLQVTLEHLSKANYGPSPGQEVFPLALPFQGETKVLYIIYIDIYT